MKEFVNCEACKVAAVNTSRIIKRPKMTEDPGLIATHGACDITDVRHWVDAPDVLLQYTTRQWMSCSLPGRHQHKNGVVARTRCGLVLLIGTDCAVRCINGWEQVGQQIKSLNVRAGLVAKLGLLPGLRARLARLKPRIESFAPATVAQTNALSHTKDASDWLNLCEKVVDPERANDDELRAFVRRIQTVEHAVGAAERAMDGLDFAAQRRAQEQRAIDTAKNVRPDVQREFKTTRRRQ